MALGGADEEDQGSKIDGDEEYREVIKMNRRQGHAPVEMMEEKNQREQYGEDDEQYREGKSVNENR